MKILNRFAIMVKEEKCKIENDKKIKDLSYLKNNLKRKKGSVKVARMTNYVKNISQ